jgi:mannitol/fructose-specific phosphotransferase system IIA component (Ntr-type)
MERQQRMSIRLVEPSNVRLDLSAASRDEAVRSVAGLLRGDPRIGSWEAFWASIGPKQVVDLKGGVCLAHGRHESVRDLALAAGRWPADGASGLPRHVFVFAIPFAMAEDYLRAVGALARACGEEKSLAALGKAATPSGFAEVLEQLLG